MMARIETLSAYRCTFSYLQRNNPLKEELQEKIKADIPPEYTFADFIEDFCKATSSLAKGEVTERAIMLPEENVYSRPSESGVKKWRIVPYAGKQGKPFRIIKTTTGKKYDFGSDSAALYEHNIFVYQDEDSAILIFHRQSGSGCKSVFLEVANKMLRQKGIKLNMELYLPLVSPEDLDVIPTKIQLQFVRDSTSTDIAENTHMEGVPLYRLYNKAQRADTVPVQRELLQIRAKNEDDVLICLPDFFGQFHAGHLRHINVQI